MKKEASFVRISGGIYRGRKISTPGEGTHPMGERERLALFNMIFEYLPEATVLDAFAGSGALGIEALSRGAKKAVFIEKDRKACKRILANLEELGVSYEQAEVICEDTSKASQEITGKFKVVLADPPYDNFVVSEIFDLAKLVVDDGILVLSHPGEAPELTDLELIKTRHYAGASISLYRFA